MPNIAEHMKNAKTRPLIIHFDYNEAIREIMQCFDIGEPSHMYVDWYDVSGEIEMLYDCNGKINNTYCESVLFAIKDIKDGKYKARYFIQSETYNGINYVKTDWNETIQQAEYMFKKNMRKLGTDVDTKGWIVVPIYYHC